MTVQANQYKISTYTRLASDPVKRDIRRLTRGYVSKEGIFLRSGTYFRFIDRPAMQSYVIIEIIEPAKV